MTFDGPFGGTRISSEIRKKLRKRLFTEQIKQNSLLDLLEIAEDNDEKIEDIKKILSGLHGVINYTGERLITRKLAIYGVVIYPENGRIYGVSIDGVLSDLSTYNRSTASSNNTIISFRNQNRDLITIYKKIPKRIN